MADLGPDHLPGLTETAEEWEAAWAPYDEPTYQAALDCLRPEDIVLDIGAGDLRFARRAARLCRRVIAVERRWDLLRAPADLPANVWRVCADARLMRWPPDVTVGVLLMRHCRHYRHYAAGLRSAGVRRLITNARWGMGVELVQLDGPRQPYDAAAGHWYACDCGAVGFEPGPPASLSPRLHVWLRPRRRHRRATRVGGGAENSRSERLVPEAERRGRERGADLIDRAALDQVVEVADCPRCARH